MTRLGTLSRSVAVSLLAVAIAAAAAEAQVAVDSQPKVVKGTAPVVAVTVSNASRANQPPATGDVLKANHTISDAEGDVIESVAYRWLRGDVEVGDAETYTATKGDTDQELRAEVTASTDDATTSPSSGTGMATVSIANAAPVATNLKIDGTRAVGQTLTARFDYADAENDEPGDHLYNWCRRGYTCDISNSATYTLGNDDYDREITFEVIPVAKAGTLQGEVARSAFGLALIPGRPVITDLRITGEYFQGSTLTAEYTYSDPAGQPESGSVIEWCWRGEKCGIASGKTMTSTMPDFEKNIEVRVTPRSASGATGTMVTAHKGQPLLRRLKGNQWLVSGDYWAWDTNIIRVGTGTLSVSDSRPISSYSYLTIYTPCMYDPYGWTNEAKVLIDSPWAGPVEEWRGACGAQVRVDRPLGTGSPAGDWWFDVYTFINKSGKDIYVSPSVNQTIVEFYF